MSNYLVDLMDVRAQRDYVQMASTCKAPSMENMMEVLAPTSEAIQSVQGFREQSRTSPYFNHLSAISESIPALGWVTIVSKYSLVVVLTK